MSEFFESEIIQDELNEINRMQEKIYGSLLSFSQMTRDDKLEHIEILTDLLEKQRHISFYYGVNMDLCIGLIHKNNENSATMNMQLNFTLCADDRHMKMGKTRGNRKCHVDQLVWGHNNLQA